MPLNRVVCPSCETVLKSAVGFNAGQPVHCPHCESNFAAEKPELENKPRAGVKKSPRVIVVEGDGMDAEAEPSRNRDGTKKRKTKSSRPYRSSPLRFVMIALLLSVLGLLSYKLYLKWQREKDSTKAARVELFQPRTGPVSCAKIPAVAM